MTTIKQSEAIPSSYPAAPAGLSDAAAALNSSTIWQRIENYIAYRWTARAVSWVVEGPGEWVPPLAPATVSTVQIWDGGQWITETLTPSPLGGYQLDAVGPYRFDASVGSGNAPAAVLEAYRRLAEYLAAEAKIDAGVTKTANVVGDLRIETERNVSWIARALINSGAADLLRPYRRAQ